MLYRRSLLRYESLEINNYIAICCRHPFMKRSTPLLRYGIAALAVALVLLLRLLLAPLITPESPFLLLAGAVVVAAWFGGLGPGLLATALGMLVADYFFLPPHGSFTGLDVAFLPLVLFGIQGVVISSLTEALRVARRRAEQSAVEAQTHQESLRWSEERFRLLVEGVEDYAIFMLDPEGRVISWNAGAERITGYREEEMIGESFSVFYAENDLERGHPEEELRVAASEGRYQEDGSRVRKDGSKFWASVLITALKDRDGKLRGYSKVMRDITERKEAEQRLLESEELYRSVVEQAAENIFLVDAETGRVIQANATLHRSLGYSPEELKRMTLYDIVAHDRETINRNIEHILEYGRRFIGERKYRRKDGSLIDVEVNAGAISYGGLRALCVVAHDITERKMAEEALRHSLDALLALYETGQVLSSSLDREEIGSRLLEIIGRTSGTTAAIIDLGDDVEHLRPWRSFGSEDILAAIHGEPATSAARRGAFEDEDKKLLELEGSAPPAERLVGLYLPLRVRDRVIGVLEVYGPETLSESGAAETFVSLANQAASALENARLYEELATRGRRLHELVRLLLTAQEEERRRVAYDIHDGLAQTAAAAYQHLQIFARHHPPESPTARDKLQEALELVRHAVGEARQVISDMRPTVLDDFGLAAAIRLQVETLRSEGWEVDYEEALGDGRLPTEMETTLFRVAQEALTNVRKHARSSRAHVTLERSGETVRLLVRDEGRGFRPGDTLNQGGPGERVGLSGMRERVSLLGGRFEIHSEPGSGTSVVAEVGLPDMEEGADHAR
jgi:PAS domain S-box-containing protein